MREGLGNIENETSSVAIAHPNQAVEPLLSVAQKLNQRYFGIRDAAVQGFIELGQELLKAKGMLAYGEFGPWCEKQLAFSWNAANAFMRIARWAETNSEQC